MPEPVKRRVLLCGGHLDGQWMTVPEWQHQIQAPKPSRILAFSVPQPDAHLGPSLDVVTYNVRPVPVYFSGAGGDLWIGVPSGLPDRQQGETVLRTVFQRDVAQHLLAEQ